MNDFTNSTTQGMSCELTADEINWELPPPADSESLTGSEVLVESVIDGLSYRLLALESIDALHRLTMQLDRERQQRLDGLAEFRTFRERVMLEADAGVITC
jgi:hypothetical protein